MSGMYTMLPLTQVLRELERRKPGERKGRERKKRDRKSYLSDKTGAEDNKKREIR